MVDEDRMPLGAFVPLWQALVLNWLHELRLTLLIVWVVLGASCEMVHVFTCGSNHWLAVGSGSVVKARVGCSAVQRTCCLFAVRMQTRSGRRPLLDKTTPYQKLNVAEEQGRFACLNRLATV